MFRRRSRRPVEPIATATVVHPGGPSHGLMESFLNGESAYKGLWKHHREALRIPEYRIRIFFGHKFFHWVNVNNRRIWIKNDGGRDISKFSEWQNLEGEVIFSRRRGQAIGIHITRIV